MYACCNTGVAHHVTVICVQDHDAVDGVVFEGILSALRQVCELDATPAAGMAVGASEQQDEHIKTLYSTCSCSNPT